MIELYGASFLGVQRSWYCNSDAIHTCGLCKRGARAKLGASSRSRARRSAFAFLRLLCHWAKRKSGNICIFPRWTMTVPSTRGDAKLSRRTDRGHKGVDVKGRGGPLNLVLRSPKPLFVFYEPCRGSQNKFESCKRKSKVWLVDFTTVYLCYDPRGVSPMLARKFVLPLSICLYNPLGPRPHPPAVASLLDCIVLSLNPGR